MKPTTTLCYMFLFVFLDLTGHNVCDGLLITLIKQTNKNITAIFSVIIIFENKNRGSTHRQGATNITCSTAVFIFNESGLS